MTTGYRSPIGLWLGGLNARTSVTGYRSPVLFWLGGLSVSKSAGGYRSPVLFWLGGLSVSPLATTPTQRRRLGGHPRQRPRGPEPVEILKPKKQIVVHKEYDDTEEILLFMTII